MERHSDLQDLLCKKQIKMAVAFFAPVAVFLLIFYGLGIYPYESLTLLTSDLNNQYVSYFAYFSDCIQNGNGLFYTFSKAVGGDMFGLAGYYLLSPVNIILFFVEIEAMPVAILLITLIKIGLAGLFMFIYLGQSDNLRYRNLIFSMAYAMSGYMVAFIFNLMWLDAVYMLPLVIMGFERICRGKRPFLYVGALAVTVISCYYTGYMVCLFVGIYGLYYIFARVGKERFKILAKFALYSIWGVAISMIALLPSLAALSGSKDSGGFGGFSLDTNYAFPQFFARLITGSSVDVEGFSDLPNVWFGTVVLVFLLLFFAVKGIGRREKLGTLAVFIILLASMYFVDIDMIWHGFARPNMFYTRYSFVFIFFAIVTAHRAYGIMAEDANGGAVKRLSVCVTAGIVLLLLAVGFAAAFDISNVKFIVLDTAFLAVTVFVILKYFKTEPVLKPVLNILLLAVTVTGGFVNAKTIISTMYHSDNSIVGFAQEVGPCVDYINGKSKYMHRIEKNFYYSVNDPMLLSYNGLSHFSSTEKDFVKAFMGNMGYMAYYRYWSHFGKGSTVAADSFCGVRYVMSRDDYEKYKLIGKSETVGVYENEYALPIMFAASEKILSQEVSGDNPFEFQNALYRGLSGADGNVFSPISYDRVYEQDGEVHYLITAESSDRIYMYIPEQAVGEIKVLVNKADRGNYFAHNGNGVAVIGSFEQGNIIDVAVKCESGQLSVSPAAILQPLFYTENREVLFDYILPMQNSSEGTVKHSGDFLTAQVSVKEGGVVMTSIPYDAGWSAYVNQEKVETCKAFDTMLAIETGEGEFEIVLKYVPAYFVPSAAISGVAFVIYLVAAFVCHCKKTKKETEDALQSV